MDGRGLTADVVLRGLLDIHCPLAAPHSDPALLAIAAGTELPPGATLTRLHFLLIAKQLERFARVDTTHHVAAAKVGGVRHSDRLAALEDAGAQLGEDATVLVLHLQPPGGLFPARDAAHACVQTQALLARSLHQLQHLASPQLTNHVALGFGLRSQRSVLRAPQERLLRGLEVASACGALDGDPAPRAVEDGTALHPLQSKAAVVLRFAECFDHFAHLKLPDLLG
mmetsp:Transcript_91691/g.213250  ORF Transcript_91691/g.213250 Transcript_91691/m.213250 type:complete len:226 (+) Transcript_91691:785-1462(+)